MKYLITGIPGVGKTTVGKLLQKHGYDFIDSDVEPGLAQWYKSSTGMPATKNPHADAAWYEAHDWNWDTIALDKLLRAYSGPDKSVLVCGMTSNITRGFPYFDKVILLQADHSTLRQRMIDRSEEPDLEAIDTVFAWADDFETQVIHAGATVVDASAPAEQVAIGVLQHLVVPSGTGSAHIS